MVNKQAKILVIASGSVAIIKTKKVIDLLAQNYDVQVIVTDFVRQNFSDYQTLKPLNANLNLASYPDHIKWAKWADLILVVPASANTIAKFYHCHADNFALQTLLAARKPIIFVPAMNTYMYEKLVKRQIIDALATEGHMFIGPVIGKLRENEIGLGRMTEPVDIVKQVNSYLNPAKKHILIPYGASKVYLDPIRFISNDSSGQMGLLLANALRLNGFQVTAVNIATMSNEQFITWAQKKRWDILISPAAFSDFTYDALDHKIKKQEQLILKLKANTDVISTLKKLLPERKFIAFKLDNDFANALAKYQNLKLDGIIWNKIGAMGAKNVTGKIVFSKYEITFNQLSKKDLAFLISEQLKKSKI